MTTPATNHPLYLHLEQLAGEASKFSIVDIETTGWSPCYHEIVEIGIVQINTQGELLDEYHTLIKPQGKIKATRIHKIQDEDVKNAPSFREAAGDIKDMLDGTCMVAQNKSFEIRFLSKAYQDMGGFFMPGNALDTVDTKHESGEGKGKLSHLCHIYDVPMQECFMHSALYDARLTTEVFLRGSGRLVSYSKHPCGIDFDRPAQSKASPRNIELPEFEINMNEVMAGWEFHPHSTRTARRRLATSRRVEYGNTELIADNWLKASDEYRVPEKGFVAMTGSHPAFVRNELIDILAEMGFVGKKDMRKSSSVLLVGDKPGKSKILQAKEFAVPTLPITEIMKLVPDDTLTVGDHARSSN